MILDRYISEQYIYSPLLKPGGSGLVQLSAGSSGLHLHHQLWLSFSHSVRRHFFDRRRLCFHIVSPDRAASLRFRYTKQSRLRPFKPHFRSARRTSGPSGCCWTSRRLVARCQLQTLRGWLFGNNENCTLSNLQREQISHLKCI